MHRVHWCIQHYFDSCAGEKYKKSTRKDRFKGPPGADRASRLQHQHSGVVQEIDEKEGQKNGEKEGSESLETLGGGGGDNPRDQKRRHFKQFEGRKSKASNPDLSED